MRATFRITAVLVFVMCFAQAAEPMETSDITVTIHDSHGLSAESTRAHVLEIILFKSHTHFHLKVSNTTQRGLILWKPYCPEGDDAMAIEFREASARDKVFRAHTGYHYTGGMGIPKVLTLAAGDDLLVNVDFLNEWVLPFSMQVGETCELEVRAVYRSAPLADERQRILFGSKEKDAVWTGTFTSEWQKVRVINRTETKIETKR